MQTSSGSSAFSEIGSTVVKDAVTRFKPKVFLSIHSGTLGMYTPYAYSDKEGKSLQRKATLYLYNTTLFTLAVVNEGNMKEVLNQLNQNFCSCPAGAAGKEVGYLCPGTCLDYAYEQLNVPYAYAWEIYEKGGNFNKLKNSKLMAENT